MSSYTFTMFKDCRGGENSVTAPDNLAPHELQVCENVDLNEVGGFSKRTGIQILYGHGGTELATRIIEYEHLDREKNRILERFVLYNGDLVDWMDRHIVHYCNIGRYLDFEIFMDRLYILGENDFVMYDGEVWTSVTNDAPDNNLVAIRRCKYLRQRGARLFAAGDPVHPNYLYFSEVLDPSVFKQASFINTITDDGDIITGLAEFQNAMLVFKRRSVHQWNGWNPAQGDVTFTKVNVFEGTSAHRTICCVDNALYYLGNSDVYGLFSLEENVFASRRLTSNVNTSRLRDIVHNTAEPHLSTACAVYKDGKYMVSVRKGDANDFVLVLFPKIQEMRGDSFDLKVACAIYTGWDIADFLNSLDGTLYSLSSNTPRVYIHLNLYNDYGRGINMHVRTRPESMGALFHNKKYRRGYVAFRQVAEVMTQCTVSAHVDGVHSLDAARNPLSPDVSLVWADDDDPHPRTWDDYAWGFEDVVTRRFRVGVRGKRIVFDFKDNTPHKGCVIYGWGVEHKLKRPDRR